MSHYSRGGIHPMILGVGTVLLLVVIVVWLALAPPWKPPAPPRPVVPGNLDGPRHPGPPPVQAALAAEPERMEGGLALRLEPEAGGLADHRQVLNAALFLEEGSSPSGFLKPGPFRATFSGFIQVDLRDRYRFSFQGRGSFELEISGQVFLKSPPDGANPGQSEPVTLRKGSNPIRIIYQSPPDGPAQMRLMWSSADFASEPVPPGVLAHDASNVDLRSGSRLRQGRWLLAQRRCTKCHQSGDTVLISSGGMEELAMDGPALMEAGGRLNSEWMAAWILDPRSVRPDAAMPKLLHGTAGPAQARDIAAFLASLNLGEPPSPAADPAALQIQAAAGGRLYAQLGCVGCHTLGSPGLAGESARIGLGHLRAKYRPGALAKYLQAPAANYPWTRMPNFGLSPQEAQSLAVFLLEKSEAPPVVAPAPESSPPGDPERGRVLVETSGCASCHALPVANRFRAPALETIWRSDWSHGCMAADQAQRAAAPDLGLTGPDRQALLALARSNPAVLKKSTPLDLIQERLAYLRCTACHTLDGRQDSWTVNASEVLSLELPPDEAPDLPAADSQPPLDISRPDLTLAGQRLRPQWMERLLAGELPDKPRPWLKARMPSFPIWSENLAAGLAAGHGLPADPPVHPSPDPALAAIGRRLIEKTSGFGCTDCHATGARPAQNVFEVQGMNLHHLTQRLNREYYDSWMMNPLRLNPKTKMPRYAEEQGRTQWTDDLAGDGHQQFEAIWHYLQELARAPRD